MQPLARVVAQLATERPDDLAFLEGSRRLSWRHYHERSEQLARVLVETGLQRGERIAVLLPDGPGVHVAYLACEKAGLVVMGIGPRAGNEELHHLVTKSGARGLLAPRRHRDLVFEGLTEVHLPVEEALDAGDPLLARGATLPPVAPVRALATDEVFLLNSTSGTTGLPKCVAHDQARWNHFHRLAVEAGELRPGDVFMSVLPAPFGFGLWTSHFTPTLLGASTLLMERFEASEMIRAIERHRVTVLSAVSTQFILMLNSPEIQEHDVGSLRVLFTGGEAVPTQRAVEFEEKTGARVLQFYGSNETGALSRTTIGDSRKVRLESAGHVIEEMQVRLFDETGSDVTAQGHGQPGCKGPLLSRGYYDDPEANAKLYTQDGWMLTGDIAHIDGQGVLTVVGRTADFIIRGGKNISGPAVEEAVASHPGVALAAAVAMPDPVFGERVCVYVEPLAGSGDLTLEDVTRHLRAQGVSREWHPERLVVVDALPRASGGKIAKGQLRADIRRRLAEAGE